MFKLKFCFILWVNCSDFYVKFSKCYGCLLCLGASSLWKMHQGELPKERNYSHHGTTAWVMEASSSDFRMCHTSEFSLASYILVTFTHADKFLLPSQPRLRLYLLSSVSSITDFTFFHSPSLFNTRTFFSPFGFKTILEILHKEVSTSVLNTLRSK